MWIIPYTTTHVRNESLINTGSAVKSGRSQLASYSQLKNLPFEVEESKQKGYLIIQDLWYKGTDCILEMRVVITDAASYLQKSFEKCLLTEDKEKNHKYLEDFLHQYHHFSPFFISVVGLLVEEVEATLKHLASLLAAKWRQPYFQTCGYVKSINAITLVQATHHCIRFLQVPMIYISA